jgi:hypothetical protein
MDNYVQVCSKCGELVDIEFGGNCKCKESEESKKMIDLEKVKKDKIKKMVFEYFLYDDFENKNENIDLKESDILEDNISFFREFPGLSYGVNVKIGNVSYGFLMSKAKKQDVKLELIRVEEELNIKKYKDLIVSNNNLCFSNEEEYLNSGLIDIDSFKEDYKNYWNNFVGGEKIKKEIEEDLKNLENKDSKKSLRLLAFLKSFVSKIVFELLTKLEKKEELKDKDKMYLKIFFEYLIQLDNEDIIYALSDFPTSEEAKFKIEEYKEDYNNYKISIDNKKIDNEEIDFLSMELLKKDNNDESKYVIDKERSIYIPLDRDRDNEDNKYPLYLKKDCDLKTIINDGFKKELKEKVDLKKNKIKGENYLLNVSVSQIKVLLKKFPDLKQKYSLYIDGPVFTNEKYLDNSINIDNQVFELFTFKNDNLYVNNNVEDKGVEEIVSQKVIKEQKQNKKK